MTSKERNKMLNLQRRVELLQQRLDTAVTKQILLLERLIEAQERIKELEQHDSES